MNPFCSFRRRCTVSARRWAALSAFPFHLDLALSDRKAAALRSFEAPHMSLPRAGSGAHRAQGFASPSDPSLRHSTPQVFTMSGQLSDVSGEDEAEGGRAHATTAQLVQIESDVPLFEAGQPYAGWPAPRPAKSSVMEIFHVGETLTATDAEKVYDQKRPRNGPV